MYPGWYDNKNVSQADEALTVETANGSKITFAQGSVVVDPEKDAHCWEYKWYIMETLGQKQSDKGRE